MEERSAGAVLYNQSNGVRRYLLLLNGGRWDFPKGNVEKGESEEQTVFREVREETGINGIVLMEGFRKVIEYFYRRRDATVHKSVVFYLARTQEVAVKISNEHQGFGWFNYPRALGKATHDNTKNLLAEADKFIRRLEGL
jgi:bis(5'-nucleosidyl)-tetraphosphatase